MDNQKLLSTLWGKTDQKDHSPKPLYHPLLHHLLDVAHSALYLWQDCVAPDVKRRVETAFGLSASETRDLIVLMCALHDLGKACPGFQYKVPTLGQATGLIRPYVYIEKPHAHISAVLTTRMAALGKCGWTAVPTVACLVSQILGAHHGTFPLSTELKSVKGTDILGDEAWENARLAICEAVRSALSLSNSLHLPVNNLQDPGVIALLAGLVSIADWIGSSAKHFPLSDVIESTADYSNLSDTRAQNALSEIGWLPRLKFGAPIPFRKMFSSIANANSMQETVESLAVCAHSPYLLIIESAMGSGKSEAAMYALDQALSQGFASGFYFALPTQATGNAMYLRVRDDYLQKRELDGKLNLQLVHGNQLTIEDLTTSPIYGDNGEIESRVVAESWFTAPKQALLAPFGVGTIDQALISVLQTRHWFVRLYGLAGKVIVFDEIHSYDIYMSQILKRLLNWLAHLDCTVIMLSATLPKDKRAELAEAYAQGRGWKLEPADVCAYPRITQITGSGKPVVQNVSGANEQSKNVSVSVLATDPIVLLDEIKNELTEGGCAAVICNTVDRAQAIYRLLRDKMEAWDVRLFHARMPQEWRQARATEVLDLYGKPERCTERPKRGIIVATQVLEQSIDLDVDWMASDMAPIDLILQRMGRLYRHERGERATKSGKFQILCDQDEFGRPIFGDANEKIYERYVLLRSWLALLDLDEALAPTLTLPADIDNLVQAAYDREPIAPNSWWVSALADALNNMILVNQQREAKAKNYTIGPPDRVSGMFEHNKQFDEDGNPNVAASLRALTRDGDPSVNVICIGIDENGNQLGPLLTKGRRSKEEVRELLKFSLPISQRKLFAALKDAEVSEWQDQPALRYCRRIEFKDGWANVEGVDLRINRDEGLVILKK